MGEPRATLDDLYNQQGSVIGLLEQIRTSLNEIKEHMGVGEAEELQRRLRHGGERHPGLKVGETSEEW